MIIEKLLEKRASKERLTKKAGELRAFLDHIKDYAPEYAGAVGGLGLGMALDTKKPWRGALLGTIGGGTVGSVAKQYYLNDLLKQRLNQLEDSEIYTKGDIRNLEGKVDFLERLVGRKK